MRTSVDIQALVTRARNGDTQAFGALYDTYVDAVYRFVFFRVGTHEDAEDITETAFVSAFEHIGTFEERGLPFEAWLFRITRNKIIDHYRKHKPRVSLDDIQDTEDPKQNPEEAVHRRLTKEYIMKQLTLLPQSYQEIIILKYIEERENEEISQLLDKPIAHVRVLQSRAIAKLRSLVSYD